MLTLLWRATVSERCQLFIVRSDDGLTYTNVQSLSYESGKTITSLYNLTLKRCKMPRANFVNIQSRHILWVRTFLVPALL